MKVLFFSIKGGVGKSSLAFNFAAYTSSLYITNDTVVTQDEGVIQLPLNKKRIPAKLWTEPDVTFDFGAMYTQLDAKITQAVSLADVIVIPTLTDMRSLHATLETVNLVKPASKPIVIIINHFKDTKKFEIARRFLNEHLGRLPILAIRTTTLFERVSRDGLDWYQNIHHEKGHYQLNKTRVQHEEIYDRIIRIGEQS
jgi:cellulose biosynthesis protein BcsQ